MRPLDTEARLASLPPAAAEAMQRVLASSTVDREAVRRAFEAVGFPPHTVPVPLASALDPAQRALAELFAYLPAQPTQAFALPLDAWNRRRWLALDPPGGLEAATEATDDAASVPLWHALANTGPGQWAGQLASLPFATRLAAFCELALGAYRLVDPPAFEDVWPCAPMPALEAADRDAAVRVADWLLEVHESPDWFPGRGVLPSSARWAVFLALVAAGVPMASRWDALLPLGTGPFEPLMLACIAAIAPARRAEAIVSALQWFLPIQRETLLLLLLPHVPERALAMALSATMDQRGGRPRRVVYAEIEALVSRDAAVRAAFANVPLTPPPPTLRLQPVEHPADPADLGETWRAQLASLLEADPDEGYELTELFTVHDAAGVHRYDMYLFCGDDGQVFLAGTTDTIASFSQGGADSPDAALCDALDDALDTWQRARRA